MKKKLLFMLLTFFASVGLVKADMGAPEISPYEMIVTAKDGIDYYDFDGKVLGHLNYNDTFKVDFETKLNDGRTEYMIIVNNDNLKETPYLFSIAGATLKIDTVDPNVNNQGISKSEGTALVYFKDGVDMYKGPSETYAKVDDGHIPNGTEVKYTHVVLEGIYMYVEYQGKKGWIDFSDSKVLLKHENYYAFAEDTNIGCATVPKGTIIKSSYRTDTWSGKTYFKYNNCEGFAKTFKSDTVVSVNTGNYVFFTKEIKMYKDIDGNTLLETIPADEVVILYARTGYWEPPYSAYVEYNGKRGWAKIEVNNSYDYVKTEQSVEYTPEITATKIEVKDPEEDEDPKQQVITEEPTAETTQTPSNQAPAKSNSFTIVLTCVITAVSLAVIAIVTIVIVNKKKKEKVNVETETVTTEQNVDIEIKNNDLQ